MHRRSRLWSKEYYDCMRTIAWAWVAFTRSNDVQRDVATFLNDLN
jgi:hypothetical protein